MQRAAAVAIVVLAAVMMASEWVAPHPYQEQFREATQAGASRQFPLGTDALGRDRLSRMLYGGRVSLACAPAAALLSGVLALGLALIGGFGGSRLEDRKSV